MVRKYKDIKIKDTYIRNIIGAPSKRYKGKTDYVFTLDDGTMVRMITASNLKEFKQKISKKL